mmetsp:Transcript_1337/g.5720  ORF Transcript_1337/g.5720 Transcript_1337/m.5720 type:complete len:108 (-) Transcript_1337:140-463(-)|eukprot:scaffold2527_cov241-Pinguiococcus_pyrenoidosus.AAC.4
MAFLARVKVAERESAKRRKKSQKKDKKEKKHKKRKKDKTKKKGKKSSKSSKADRQSDSESELDSDDSGVMYSAVSGRKIRLRREQSAADVAEDRGRKELLRLMNARY